MNVTKALVFLAAGFEEIETVTVVDILKRAEVNVTVAGLTANVTEGKHGLNVVPDKSIDDMSVTDFDAVIVPGGNTGYKNLRKDPRVIAMVKKASESNKILAAICAGPTVLADAGVLEGKECTIYPGMEKELEAGGGKPKQDMVVVDGNIVTSKGPATALPFGIKLAEMLAGKQVAEAVGQKTLANIMGW